MGMSSIVMIESNITQYSYSTLKHNIKICEFCKTGEPKAMENNDKTGKPIYFTIFSVIFSLKMTSMWPK